MDSQQISHTKCDPCIAEWPTGEVIEQPAPGPIPMRYHGALGFPILNTTPGYPWDTVCPNIDPQRGFVLLLRVSINRIDAVSDPSLCLSSVVSVPKLPRSTKTSPYISARYEQLMHGTVSISTNKHVYLNSIETS